MSSSPRRTTAVLRSFWRPGRFLPSLSSNSKFPSRMLKNADVGLVAGLEVFQSAPLPKLKTRAFVIRRHHLNGLVHIHAEGDELGDHGRQIEDHGHSPSRGWRSVLSVSGKKPCKPDTFPQLPSSNASALAPRRRQTAALPGLQGHRQNFPVGIQGAVLMSVQEMRVYVAFSQAWAAAPSAESTAHRCGPSKEDRWIAPPALPA